MFNEILTGKAPAEQQPAAPLPAAPPAPQWSAAAAEASARAYAESEAQRRRSQNSHKILGIGLACVVGLGIAAFRWGMRNQMEEDARVMRGGSRRDVSGDAYFHPFVTEVRGFASQMCSCADKACSWSVQGGFDRWSRTQTPPDDEAVLDAAAHETARYETCRDELAKK